MVIAPGARLGSYEVTSLLGSGGMGEVYRAWDTKLQRPVAIKVLPKRYGSEAAAHLLHEARAASALNHPSICTIYETGEAGGHAFMAMELVEGRALSEFGRARPLVQETVVQYAAQICDALAHAHDRGVIHRDLKPANVMITRDGRAKVLDFGLAQRLVAQELEEITRSVTELDEGGTIRGTLPYMAPEVFRGEAPDARADIWALGVLLYELAVGQLPFKGRTAFELTAAILQTPVVLPAQLSAPFRAVIGRCLSKDPHQRFQTAREVRAALEALQPPGPEVIAHVRLLAWGAIGAVVLTTLSLASRNWLLPSRSTDQATRDLNLHATARRSIAVVGFRNVSGRPELAWLSTGLSQMLTTELGVGDRLRTIPGETIARMRTELALTETESFAKDTLAKIRINVGTDLVAFGSFVALRDESTEQLRVDLRLQDAGSGDTVASIAETGRLTDLFDLVARLGRRLRQSLEVPEPSAGESAGSLRASLPSAPEAARLYAEGLAKLWRFDALSARDLLSKAIGIEPSHALAHSALAAALADLGEDAKAQVEAKKAFELSGSLSRQDRLWIEGRYRETSAEWGRAADLYKTLFEFYPDNEEYGLRLGDALISGGRARDALAMIEELRRLPDPARNDPRIDLLESRAAEGLSDFAHERSSAQKAVDKGIANGASLIVARARIAEAWALKNQGQPENALAANEEARRLYAAAGDNRGVSRALTQIGATLREQGKLADASEAFASALTLARSLSNKRSTATALNGLANVLFDQGRFADAKHLYEQSLALNREVGDKVAIAQSLDNLASALYEQAEVAESARLDAESLALRREIGERRGIAASLVNMAEVSFDQGDVANATKMYQESLVLYREIGNKAMEAYSLAGMGAVLLAQGNLSEARKAGEQALAIREGLGNRDAAAESMLALAEVGLEAGAVDDKQVNDVLARFEKAKRTDQAARACVLLARTLVARGNRSGARDAVQHALDLGQHSESRGTRLYVQIAAAQIRASIEPGRNSPRAVEALIQEAKRTGMLVLELEARLASDQLQMQRDSPTSARTDLAAVEAAAAAKGLTLVARKAHALRQAHTPADQS